MSLGGESNNINDPKGIINTGDDALLQSIYDFFPGLVYVYDLDKKRILYINKKVSDSLGYTYDDINSWDQDFGRLVFKDDVELVRGELEKFHELKQDDSHNYRCRLNKKEGDYIHFQVTGKVLRRNAQGKAESVLFVAQDINEQIRAADQAMAFQQMMNETENLLRFATWHWDGITNSDTWSKGVYTLLNYDEKTHKEKITTKIFLDHVVPADRKRIDALYEESIKSRQEFLAYEYSIITDDGEAKIIHSTIRFRYANDVLIGALGINRDVTEKSILLNNLLAYREMIMERETFLDQGTFEVDILNNNITWSDGMYTLYGYDPVTDKGSLIIDEALFKKHLFDEDFEVYRAKRAREFEMENSNVWQIQIITKAGEVKQLETFSKLTRDVNGNPARLIGTTRDVTKIAKYERDLERKISELRRSNKDLEDFAYIASHDMHEPLRKVHSFADRLKTTYSKSLEDEAKGYLDRILAATQNARLMIDGLMEFSRLSRNGFWFEKADIKTLVEEVLSDLELKIEETNTKIEIGEMPELEVIKVQIKQLFSNVILNAIKFRKEKTSPEIVIKSRKLTRLESSELNLDTNADFYRLSVKDNGIGFEQEYAETIFQMFQRLNSKSEYPGSGIGLALCKKIAENHQGTIMANSIPGEGTVISVILPVKHK